MAGDLVDLLRTDAALVGQTGYGYPAGLMRRAADEIERLRAERNMAEDGRLSAVAWGARMEFRAIEAECALANAKRDAK